MAFYVKLLTHSVSLPQRNKLQKLRSFVQTCMIIAYNTMLNALYCQNKKISCWF